MAGNRNNRYQVPKETEEDKKLFQRLCKNILQDQISLIESAPLSFRDIKRIGDGIRIARARAKKLNQRYRLKRKVP